MTALVLLEFDASGIKQPSRSAVAAAQKLGEVHALVAGGGDSTARRLLDPRAVKFEQNQCRHRSDHLRFGLQFRHQLGH